MRAQPRVAILGVVLTLASTSIFVHTSCAQESSGGRSWSSTSQQDDPSGATNPYRTTTTHSEVNGRTIDRTVVEARGPDGRYVPYSVTERESVKVNDTTVRNVERNYATNADGRQTLTQERREESNTLPGGESKVTSTVSNPDANGGMQIVQRTETDSKQTAPGARDTNTTVFSIDSNGGLSASMRIEEHERHTDPKTIESKKSTSLFDGTGRWNVSEVREATTKAGEGGTSIKDERVMRPDAEGKMALVEQTLTRQADSGSGEKRDTTETYSTNVPGQAGDEGLKLVQRESTVHRTDSSGRQNTTRLVESSNPGDPGAGLQVTQQAIDIVRPGTNGVAQQTSTVTTDVNGNTNAVWVDMGQSDKPASVKDTAPAPAMKKK